MTRSGGWRRIHALLVVLMLGACSRAGPDDSGPIVILAASDLQHALPDLVRAYQREGGDSVQLVFGSTGRLASQVEQGLPADLFFAADRRYVDRLARMGFVQPASQRVYAVGRLAVVWAAEQSPVRSLLDLRERRFRTVALAHPDHAPYGAAARSALQSAGIWDAVEPRCVFGDNVIQTLQHVTSGNADAGLVALSVVRSSPGARYLVVDSRLHPSIQQAAAVLTASARAAAAHRFLSFVLSTPGQEILRRHGLEPPAEG